MSVETGPYLGMLRRMIAAGGRRVADADEVELAQLISLQSDLDEAIATAIAGQRQRGRSWATIAVALGTTRQSAHERWAKRTGAAS